MPQRPPPGTLGIGSTKPSPLIELAIELSECKTRVQLVPLVNRERTGRMILDADGLDNLIAKFQQVRAMMKPEPTAQ